MIRQSGIGKNSLILWTAIVILFVVGYFVFLKNSDGISGPFPLNDKKATYIIRQPDRNQFVMVYTKPGDSEKNIQVFVSENSRINLDQFVEKPVIVSGDFATQMVQASDCGQPICDHRQIVVLRIEKIKFK